MMVLSQNTQMVPKMQGPIPAKAPVGQEAFQRLAQPRAWLSTTPCQHARSTPAPAPDKQAPPGCPPASRSFTLPLCPPDKQREGQAGSEKYFPLHRVGGEQSPDEGFDLYFLYIWLQGRHVESVSKNNDK